MFILPFSYTYHVLSALWQGKITASAAILYEVLIVYPIGLNIHSTRVFETNSSDYSFSELNSWFIYFFKHTEDFNIIYTLLSFTFNYLLVGRLFLSETLCNDGKVYNNYYS